MLAGALFTLLLAQVPADDPLPPLETAGPPGLELVGGGELGLALVAGALAVEVRPSLSLELGPDFSAQLGGPLRFTAMGPPRLRGQDWAELSDAGQLLTALAVGGPGRSVQLRAGAL